MYRKGLIKKIKINFKFYDATVWLTNNSNTNIAQYFEISDFVSHVYQTSNLIPLLFDLIHSVSAEVSLNCICRVWFKCFFFWPWENQYMVHGFDFISITQFPAMICSVSAEGSLNRVAYSIQIFLLLALSKSFLLNLCAFAPRLPLSSKIARKLVLRYVRTRWMAPNKCCGIFFCPLLRPSTLKHNRQQGKCCCFHSS